ncbi:hypothetical protein YASMINEVIRUS_8 [Yasminevirus sp. GU-2018]|uniref:C2H2-type domain-containing protein n=1 Tax=Yasminevirus sp. GU-2018 TaxID=2420051 RepID=A0A5K0U8U3_9VIRU|nr:hypothetical protein YASMINEVIRUS_8 [Yasminevirus sp. GU-2018]
MNKQRKVSDSTKKTVAGSQFFKCANSPRSRLLGLESYLCPLWQRKSGNEGCFDQAGYEIDHIEEFSVSGNDNIKNLQALCKMCHAVKTKAFMQNLSKSRSKKTVKCDDDEQSESDIESELGSDIEESDSDDDLNSQIEEDYISNRLTLSKYVCDKCDKEFKRKENLDYHVKHDACINREYPCKACDKLFASRSGMYRHMRDSCNLKKQQCDEKKRILERLVRVEKELEAKKASDAKESKREKDIKQLKRTNKKLLSEIKKRKAEQTKTIM